MDHPDISVYCGIDVGKSSHHAVALRPDGSRIFDKQLPQNETARRELFVDLRQHGEVMVTVDQPRNIGALPVIVARNAGVSVTYLPGLAMRRTADTPREGENRCSGRVRHCRRSTHPARFTAQPMTRRLRI
ncbi:IS110 family transposase [Rhodococcus sp. KBS0724]|nr:transposase [Rhodococcus sp. KBS0724]TSD40352.1 IS110 family transposase [Rhodococcus sp. KBS0724]